MGACYELITGLIEADMAVGANAQKLQVYAAQTLDPGVIIAALSRRILRDTAGDIGIGQIDVDMV